MLNRWIEGALLPVLDELGVGCIAFSPLAQGLLTNKYLNGVPAVSRVTTGDGSFQHTMLSEANLQRVRGLHGIAERRGQSLAQMAIAWSLRDPRVTSSLIGARTVAQLDDSLDSLKHLEFSPEELGEIDEFAVDVPEIDLWRGVSTK